MTSTAVRRRVVGAASEEVDVTAAGEPAVADDSRWSERDPNQLRRKLQTTKSEHAQVLQTSSFWFTRIVFIRSLAFIYFVAFLVALHQNEALIGSDGLLPADVYMKQIHEQTGGKWQSFLTAPSLFWLLEDYSNMNACLNVTAYLGVVLSAAVMVSGGANMVAMFILWILYQSIVNVGQRWYSFGWESQLLETGFLAIFWCPLMSWRKFPKEAPSKVVIWGYRWLLFRIMIGAGLIKIRGDKCWRDLTCMDYHYQTQPVPNPMSYYMHQSPQVFHKFETLSNHFIELIVPWFTFTTRKGRLFCGFFQILFQVVLIISGNLSFLNWLTMLPAICYFDDASLSFLFGRFSKAKVAKLQCINAKPGRVRRTVHLILGLLIAYLSLPVVVNLLSTRQKMNYTFDPFRIVNTYGAFGSVTKTRTEVVLEGTYSQHPQDPSAEWLEYEFKCKPGNVTRRPCVISPYHYRLDWLIWFAAFQNYQYNPWLVHLAGKLLVNDYKTSSLLAYNPFERHKPPRFIRAKHYTFTFTKIGSTAAQNGRWWKRKYRGEYLPPVSLSSLAHIFRDFQWKIPKDPYHDK